MFWDPRYRAGRVRSLMLLLLLCAGHVRGQYLVDLSEAGPLEVPAGLYIDSVVASFSDSARIGTVMRGMGNKPVPAFLSGGISKGIEGVLSNAPHTDATLHCTMRVNALDIREISKSASEECLCALNFELLANTEGNWTRIYEYAATNSSGGGMDATNKQPANIQAAFVHGFAGFARQQQAGDLPVPVPVPVPGPRAGKNDRPEVAYPVLAVGAPARGLYPDFMAFRDQHPDTSLTFTLKPVSRNDPRIHLAKLKTPQDVSPPAAVWGLSDGNDLYINVGKRFLRMDRSGTDFKGVYAFGGKDQADVGMLAVGVAAGIAFGMLGGVLIYVGSSGREYVPVHLDLLTGDLLPDNLEQNEGIVADATSDHLFMYSRHCPVDTTVRILVYGGLEAALHKDGYHVLSLVPRPGPVPVEFQVGEGPPLSIEITTDRTGGEPDVYLIRVGKDGIPTVDRLNAPMSRAALSKLDPDKAVK